MTDSIPTNAEALEAERNGERPDHGRMPDALAEALSGSGGGSDTRAGSLQGGVASGSDDDADQRSVDGTMADEGRARAKPQVPSQGDRTEGDR